MNAFDINKKQLIGLFQKWFYLNELTYATEPPDEDEDY